jgi:type II secretory ATPase GspE/PulE/Tfp pilus assembly ATPase PilB-like protein
MYSSFCELRKNPVNISTLENPVECAIDGIKQIVLGNGRTTSVSDTVRSLLHQDVDVLGLGSVTSKDEAQILIEACLAGMRAFTSIQATDSIRAVLRLQSMGIRREDLSYVLNGVVAQRFVRKICLNCMDDYKPSDSALNLAGLSNLSTAVRFKRGKGCNSCLGTGYLGKIPLFEVLVINDHLSSLIFQGASREDIKIEAQKLGFTTMRYDGLRKAIAGVTTLEEVLRVT